MEEETELQDYVPVARSESPFNDDSGESDNISLSSTVYSEYDDDDIFPVEKVLAERSLDGDGGNKEFLVKWEGWSELSATWQPWKSFQSGQDDTLLEWQTQKMREARGKIAPFDVDAWQERQDLRHIKHFRRHFRRNRRRIRLGLVPTWPLEEEFNEDDSDGEDQTPAAKLVDASGDEDASKTERKRRAPQQHVSSSEDEGPLLKHKQRRVSTTSKPPAAKGPSLGGSRPSVRNRAPSESVVRTQKKTTGQGSARRSTATVPSATAAKPSLMPWDSMRPSSGSHISTVRGATVAATVNASSQQRQAPVTMRANKAPARPTKQQASAALASAKMKRLGGKSHVFGNPIEPKKRAGAGKEPTSLKEAQKAGANFVNLAQRNTFQKFSRTERAPEPDALTRFGLSSIDTANVAERRRNSATSPTTAPDVSSSLAQDSRFKDRETYDRTNANTGDTHASRPRNPSLGTVAEAGSTLSGARRDEIPHSRSDFQNPLSPGTGGAISQARNERNFERPLVLQDRSRGSLNTRTTSTHSDQLSSPIANNGRFQADPRTDDTRVTKKDLTCYFWRTSGCAKDESDCWYAHAETGRNAPPPPGFIEPEKRQYSTRQCLTRQYLTCPFWFAGNCRNLARECFYAHEDKPKIAANPATGEEERPNPRVGESASREARLDTSSRNASLHNFSIRNASKEEEAQDLRLVNGNFPADRMTCWWYWFSKCKYSASTCRLAHEAKFYIASHQRGDPPIRTDSTEFGREELERRLKAQRRSSDVKAEERLQQPLRDLRQERPTADWSRSHSSSPPLNSARKEYSPPLVLPFAYPAQKLSRTRSFPITEHPTTPQEDFIINDDPMAAIKTTLTFRNDTVADKNNAEIEVIFQSVDEESKKILRKELSKFQTLKLKSACVVESAHLALSRTTKSLAAGTVLPSKESGPAFDRLVNILRLNSCAALILLQSITVVLYHPNDSWKFLELATNSYGDSGLRIAVLPALPTRSFNPNSKSVIDDSSGHSKLVSLDPNRGFDAARLFTFNGAVIERNVFLMFPPSHERASQSLSRILESSHFGATVFRSTEPGSWKRFDEASKSGDGAVIVSPSFNAYHRIPNLLSRLDKRINFFKIEFDTKTGDTSSMQLSRIFTHGRAVLILDDCFQLWPKDTLSSVSLLLERIRNKPPGLTRIVGRPGLLDWLRELALASRPDSESSLFIPETSTRVGDTELVREELFVMLDQLYGSDPKFQDKWFQPTADSPIFFDPPSDFYSNLAQNDSKQAAEFLVYWFSIWARDNVQSIRKFLVLTELGREMREEWKKKYSFLDVMTPEMYCREARPAMSTSASRKRQ